MLIAVFQNQNTTYSTRTPTNRVTFDESMHKTTQASVCIYTYRGFSGFKRRINYTVLRSLRRRLFTHQLWDDAVLAHPPKVFQFVSKLAYI